MSNSVPNQVNVYQDQPNRVLVDELQPNHVLVRTTDSLSVTTRRHVHTQNTSSSTWTITHDLGGRPSVTIVDTAGTVVIGEVSYESDTEITVSFTAPFSGYAYLT
jgi:hypothetical protein